MPAAADMGRWLIVILLLVLLSVASVSDIRNRRIPNWTVLAIIFLFVPWVVLSPHGMTLSALGAALGAFLISFPLYALRVVGAGDSKLLTAVALFVGLGGLLQFMTLVVLAGGGVAAVSLLMRPTRALVLLQMRGKGGYGRGIPYGVAIAIAAAYMIAWPLAGSALTR